MTSVIMDNESSISKNTITFNSLGHSDLATDTLVNIGAGNGLMRDGTKQLPEQMLTYH